jgi:hypothetical protein
VKVNPEIGQFPSSRRRDSTAILVMPTFSRKLYRRGGEIPLPSSACPHFLPNSIVEAARFHCCPRRAHIFSQTLLSRRRDPTAVFVVPTFSRRPSTSQRHPHCCLCCGRSYSFLREAKALAGGGVTPSAALTVPMAIVCDSDISQWGVLMKFPYPTRLIRFHVTEFRGEFLRGFNCLSSQHPTF